MVKNPIDDDDKDMDTEDNDEGFKDLEATEDGDEFKRDWCV